jgi:hypothetical protein
MIRTLAPILIIFFFQIPRGYAQPVELFGYYEPQYMGVSVQDRYDQLFTNKLRVDLQSSAMDNVKFAANFDFITYHGDTEWNFLDFLPQSIRATVPPSATRGFAFIYGDSIFLDNAYMKIGFSSFDITVGKQQISLGTGYVWNPTDLFNFKDFTDPTYEQPGHNSIRVDISLPRQSDLTMIYIPEDNWDDSQKLIKYKENIGHFDISACFIEKQWQFSNFIYRYIWPGSGYNPQLRRLYGGSFVGELFGLGLWGEMGFNTFNRRYRDFLEIVFGLDYTLDNGTYLLSEYYRNGLAKSDYRDYDLNDWMRFFMAESKSVSRDNLYLYVDYPLTDLIHLNNSAVASLPDMSLALIPGLNYSLYQDVELTVFVNIYTGKEKTAYNSNLGTGGIVRLRVYF